MGAAIGNPAGFVQVFDGGVPKIITGYAREIISGGCFVMGSTAAAVVSSGLNSFVASDIKFSTNASGLACNGVALNTAASGAPVAVAMGGIIIALADGTVTSGFPQVVNGVNAVRDIATGSLSATQYPVGRAIVDAGSEGYTLLSLIL